MTSARDLSARLAGLLRRERHAAAEFLVALADFDRLRAWTELGYTSLFYYLHRELGMSKGAAQYRKTAAELIQRFPEVVEPLTDGRLCITSVVELARVITPENRGEVLPRFFNVSRDEAKDIAAEVRPVAVPPQRAVVTPISDPRSEPGALTPSGVHAESAPGSTVEPLLRVPSPRPAETVPLTAALSRLHLTVSRRLLAKLHEARDALSHSHPSASADEIIEVGLDLILERAAKRRGLVENPRSAPPPSSGDTIPAHVRRAVWNRDGGRCTFPLANGGVCGSTERMELDHVVPRALGGEPTVENLRLRCRCHNVVEARRVFGDEVMDLFTRAGRGALRREPPPPSA